MSQADNAKRPDDVSLRKGGVPVAKLQLLRQIVADPEMRFADLKVAVILLDRHNARAGYCYPSTASLAVDTFLGERTVRRSVQKLVERGYFRVTPGGGRNHSSHYWPNLKKEGAWTPLLQVVSPSSPEERGVQESSKGGVQSPERGVCGPPEPRKEPEKEPVGLPQHKTTEESNERRRGSRLDPDWQPGQRDREYARGKGFGDAEISAMCDSFVAHFTNGPGRKKTWIRWSGGNGAWGNWVRNQFKPKRGGDRPSSGGIVAGTLEDIAALEGKI